jgi:membrane fusion protein, peptide pheromone/bacteriocin exporter
MANPASFIPVVELSFQNRFTKPYLIYWLLASGVIACIAVLPFIYFDISVKSPGIIRPVYERTDIRPMLAGIIDTIYFREGDFVKGDCTILRLKDYNSPSKIVQNDYELRQRRQFIHDLALLTSTPHLTTNIITSLKSPVYKQQISRFLYQKSEQEASLKKVKKELHIDSILSVDRVIAPKEMFDKIIENEKLQAAYSAFKNEQISIWQQDLAKYRLELSQLEAQRKQIEVEEKLYKIKTPITGIVQGIYTKYPGGIVHAGETLCSISPETELIAECYISTSDIGLLKINQKAKFQIEAFDYNYFGTLTGRIIHIDNDFTLVESKPIFKVRCSFDKTQLHLKNGYTGQLKKGLTVQARFIVARRSLWQLLFDKIDDWLNPAAPVKK